MVADKIGGIEGQFGISNAIMCLCLELTVLKLVFVGDNLKRKSQFFVNYRAGELFWSSELGYRIKVGSRGSWRYEGPDYPVTPILHISPTDFQFRG